MVFFAKPFVFWVGRGDGGTKVRHLLMSLGVLSVVAGNLIGADGTAGEVGYESEVAHFDCVLGTWVFWWCSLVVKGDVNVYRSKRGEGSEWSIFYTPPSRLSTDTKTNSTIVPVNLSPYILKELITC